MYECLHMCGHTGMYANVHACVSPRLMSRVFFPQLYLIHLGRVLSNPEPTIWLILLANLF